MIDVCVVLGTRPELLKLAPVVHALRERRLSAVVVLTGQHADLLDETTLKRLGPVVNLGIPSDGSVLRFTHAAEGALLTHIVRLQPRVVMVQGDTASAHAGALTGARLGIPVAHVEAGLRSGDLDDPWPEEGIRRAITKLATWHYAPTTVAAMQLGLELRNRRNAEVVITGNTSVDALLGLGVKPQPEAGAAVLVTLHRRELRERADVGEVLQALADAVAATPAVRALWPVHPAMAPLIAQLRLPFNFGVAMPLPHGMLAVTLAGSRGVLTDSGGLVEEAATLGVPTAVLRNVTDRPEAEEAGIACRFPTTPRGAAAAWGVVANCDIARTPRDCYGDGTAALRIARHLAAKLAAQPLHTEAV